MRRGLSVPVLGNFGFGVFLGFCASLCCLVHMGSASFASLPVVYKAWVISVFLLLDTPFGRRSVEALPFVTSGENA